jgi:histidinol phosphatase-like enzyme
MIKVLGIDFDGVIHDYKHPIKGRRMGAPIEGTKEALERLKRQGYKIIIHTVWGDEKGQKTIADFMKYYELPYDEITNIKPQADWYIDDKAIHFESWKDLQL